MIQILLAITAAAYVAKTMTTRKLADIKDDFLKFLNESQEKLKNELHRVSLSLSELQAASNPISILLTFIDEKLQANNDAFNDDMPILNDAVREAYHRALIYKSHAKRIELFSRIASNQAIIEQSTDPKLIAWMNLHVRSINELIIQLYFERDVISYKGCEQQIEAIIRSNLSVEKKIEAVRTLANLVMFIDNLIADYLTLVLSIIANYSVAIDTQQKELEAKIHTLEITVKEFSNLIKSHETIQESIDAINTLHAQIANTNNVVMINTLHTRLAYHHSSLILASMQLYLLELMKRFFFTNTHKGSFYKNAVFSCYLPVIENYAAYHDILFQDHDSYPQNLIIQPAIIEDLDAAIALFKIPFPNYELMFEDCLNVDSVPIVPKLPQLLHQVNLTTQVQANPKVAQTAPALPPRPVNNKLGAQFPV